MTVVERIFELCNERGIPISRLEKECGFANAYFARLKGRDIPSERLKKVSEVLNVSIEYLMTGTQTHYYIDEESREAAEELRTNKELRLLFDAGKDASPDDLRTVHQMLLALKRKEQGNE